jgi:ankyrin repeat protein
MQGVTSPLHHLARCAWQPQRTERVLKLMLKHGINVNVLNGQKETPLFHAAMKGQAETARLLLELGRARRIARAC